MFQSNWTEKDEMSPAFIRNKPNIGQGGDVDLSDIESDIDALKEKVGALRYKTVHMVNHARGCVDINTLDRRLEITDEVYVYADDAKRAFSIKPSMTDWITGEYPDNDTYYVVVDGVSGDSPVYVIGGNSDADDWPELENPVYVGMFYVRDGEMQGLSFCNDDVKVDGRYISDNAASLDISDNATFLGETRGDMNIDTVGKVVTLANSAVIITDGGRYTIPAGSYAWNKGNASEYYENIYTVYADIATDGPKKLSIVAAGVSFIPMEKAYRIGAFYWTGSEVGGISFGNDVFVDGAYVYGSGGGVSDDVYTLLKSIITSDLPIVLTPDDAGKKIKVSVDTDALCGLLAARFHGDGVIYSDKSHSFIFNGLTNNLFNPLLIETGLQLIFANGIITTSPDYSVSGLIPVTGGATYRMSGLVASREPMQYTTELPLAFYDAGGAPLLPKRPNGTDYIQYGISLPAVSGGYTDFKAPDDAVTLRFSCVFATDDGYMWSGANNDIGSLTLTRQ
jgi:hypothetical protein